jgi:hypothetical protein
LNGRLFREYVGGALLALEALSFAPRPALSQDSPAPESLAKSDQLRLPPVQLGPIVQRVIHPSEINLIPGESAPVILIGGGEHLPHEVFDRAVKWAIDSEIATRGSEIEQDCSVAVISWANWDPPGCLEAARARFGAVSDAIEIREVPTFEEIFLELAQKLGIESEYQTDSERATPELIDAVLAALNDPNTAAETELIRKEVADRIIESLKRSPVLFISGGLQALLVLMFKVFGDVRDFISLQSQQGRVLVMGTSAGCAVLGADPVILGNNLEHAAAGSGLSRSLVESLIDWERSDGLKCVVAKRRLGLSRIFWCVDQHHGGPGEDGRYFEDDQVTPLNAFRKDRTDRFAALMAVSDTNQTVREKGELDSESNCLSGPGGFAIWEGAALVVTNARDVFAPLVLYARAADGDSARSDTLVPAAQYFVGGGKGQVVRLDRGTVWSFEQALSPQEPSQ